MKKWLIAVGEKKNLISFRGNFVRGFAKFHSAAAVNTRPKFNSTFFSGAFVLGWVKVLCKLKIESIAVNGPEKRQSEHSARRQREKIKRKTRSFWLKILYFISFRWLAKTGWPQCWKWIWNGTILQLVHGIHMHSTTEYIWNYWSCAIHLLTSHQLFDIRSQYKPKFAVFLDSNAKEKFFVIFFDSQIFSLERVNSVMW